MSLSIFTIFSSSSVAYIDPSTGGVLLNTIWPFIVAFFTAVAAFFIKWFWRPIKKTFLKFTKTDEKVKSD